MSDVLSDALPAIGSAHTRPQQPAPGPVGVAPAALQLTEASRVTFPQECADPLIVVGVEVLERILADKVLRSPPEQSFGRGIDEPDPRLEVDDAEKILRKLPPL